MSRSVKPSPSKPLPQTLIVEDIKMEQLELYVEGRPMVLFVQAGPGIEKEKLCDMLTSKFDDFVHLNVEQL